MSEIKTLTLEEAKTKTIQLFETLEQTGLPYEVTEVSITANHDGIASGFFVKDTTSVSIITEDGYQEPFEFADSASLLDYYNTLTKPAAEAA